MSTAREYTPTTKRRLDTLSGNECASPDCTKPLVAKDRQTIISKICHIKAASAEGPRFDSAMSDDERRHYNNLILLCDECHSIIDNKVNELLYPVSLLEEWKKNHESRFSEKKLSGRPSLLKDAINAISAIDIADLEEKKENLVAFNISSKISFNEIKRNKSLIEEYKVHYSRINSLYDELERQGSFKKEKLLKNVNRIYLNAKGKYVLDSSNQIEIIKANSDAIIDDVFEELMKVVEDDKQLIKEDITLGISLIMVDAFMRCKILEEPPNDSK